VRPPPALRRLRIRQVVATVAIAALLAGCGAPQPPHLTMVPTRGGTAVVAVVGGPAGCRPDGPLGGTAATAAVDAVVLPSAFTVSPTGQWVLNQSLFTQVELINTAPQMIVYTLNPRAVWGDGRPVSVADLVANWRHGAAGNSALSPAYRLITSIVASPDGHDATVTFAHPYSDWRALFASMLPARVVEQRHLGCTVATSVVDVSAGPYVIAEASASKVVLRRNPRWWGARPILDRLIIKLAPTTATAIGWVTHNEAQVATVNNFTAAEVAAAQGAHAVSSTVGQTTTMLQLVFDLHHGVGQSIGVRSVVAAAVNSTLVGASIVGFVSHDFGNGPSLLGPRLVTAQTGVDVVDEGLPPIPTTTTTTTTTVPPMTTTTTTSPIPGYRLTTAGWRAPSGRQLRIRIGVAQSMPWATTVASTLRSQLRDAGIETSIVRFASQVDLTSAIVRGWIDAGILVRTATVSMSSSARWFSLPKGRSWTVENPGGYDNPTVDASFLAAQEYLNPVDAAGAYAAIAKQLSADNPAVELVTIPTLQLWRTALNNVFRFPYATAVTQAAPQWTISIPVPTTAKTPPTLAPTETAR